MSDTILSGDLTVFYAADGARKQIKWSGSATTPTYTVNQVYSAIQDLFDELAQMDDGSPMSAQTPTEYTIGAIDPSDIVPWFIDDETIQRLKGGAIKTALWTRITGVQPGIVKVKVTGNTSIVYGDIGNSITNGTSTGVLLDLQGSGSSTVLFIRPTDATSTHDWSATSVTITCNSHTTGAITASVFTGESLWPNIYSLGSIATDKGNNPISDLYVYKNGVKVTSLSSGVSGYQWWATGHTDILMKVKEAGATTFTCNTNGSITLSNLSINSGLLRIGQPIFGTNIATGTTVASIVSYNSITISQAATGTTTGGATYANTIDGGFVTVFAREYDNVYDYFAVDLNSGGRNPIPLATGDDLNNHTGIRQLTASAGAGTFQVGEIAYVGASLAAATAKAVITSVTGTGATSIIRYYLIGNLTDFAGGVQTVTGAVSAATITTGAVANNSAATYNPATMTGMAVNSVINGYTVDLNNGNGGKQYSIQIDPGTNKYPLSAMYEWTKYATRRGSTDTTDNNGINGEAYIGIDYKLSYTTLTGSQMASGDKVFQASTGAFGTVVTHDTTNKFIIVRNTRGSFGTGAVVDVNTPGNSTDAGTSSSSITPIKPNPYGSFAGGKFFAATGVTFNNANLALADIQAYQLTALDNSTQTPPNVVQISLTGLVVGDATSIFRAVSGVIDKAQYTCPTVAASGGTSLVVTSGTRTAIATDEPSAGFLRIVKTTGTGITDEHRYRYASWSGTTFTLAAVTAGQDAALTATAAQYWNSQTGSASTGGNLARVTLGTAISTSEVQVGDMLYTYATATPGTPLSAGMIVKIEDTTHLWVRDVSNTITLANYSGVGNKIAFNKLSQTYANTDKIYIPLIDTYIASGTSTSNSLIFSATIPVLARVRQYKNIVPFEQATSVSSTGLTISAIRTSDSIAS